MRCLLWAQKIINYIILQLVMTKFITDFYIHGENQQIRSAHGDQERWEDTGDRTNDYHLWDLDAHSWWSCCAWSYKYSWLLTSDRSITIVKWDWSTPNACSISFLQVPHANKMIFFFTRRVGDCCYKCWLSSIDIIGYIIGGHWSHSCTMEHGF